MKDILSFPILVVGDKMAAEFSRKLDGAVEIVEFSNIMLASRFQISIIISNKICCKR